MGQFVEDLKGYVREQTPADDARPITVFDMQPVPPVQPAAAKKSADTDGSKK